MTVKLFFVLVTVSIPVYGILTPADSPLSAVVDSNISDDDKNRFGEWKKSFQRTYKSPAEEQKALKNLVGNLKEIEVHNIRYNAGRETYSRALWEMSDLSFEEKSAMLAGSTFNFTSLQLQGPAKKFKAAPSQVNWVKDGRVNSVQNQGRCGSCFAFAAVGTAEGVLLKKGIKTRLSVQQIVDCDKANAGCDGGDPLQAFRYIKSNGLASSDSYQYSGRESQCRKKGSTTIPITSAVRERLNGNENRLKQTLATYGPVTVAINAAKSLTNYRSGVYTNPKCSKNLDHAVLLVGYGHDEKTKLDYWLVKNSWGTSWGESGYVRMARNKGSICGIASEVIYAT